MIEMVAESVVSLRYWEALGALVTSIALEKAVEEWIETNVIPTPSIVGVKFVISVPFERTDSSK